MMVYLEDNSNAYIFRESFADMLLAKLKLKNIGHLFHKIQKSLGNKLK